MAIKYTTPEVAKNTTSRDIEALAAQECKLQEKSVEYTQNAEFVVTPDEGYDGMFQNTTLSSWNIDLSSVQSAGGMFGSCQSLTTVTTNFSGLTMGGAIFSDCPNLTTITLTGTLDADYLDFSVGLEALTIDSLVSILDALKDRTGDTQYTLVLGESHLSKLADEQKAIATNKNWILA